MRGKNCSNCEPEGRRWQNHHRRQPECLCGGAGQEGPDRGSGPPGQHHLRVRNIHNKVEADTYTCLIDDEDVRGAIVKTEYNADLLPSNTQLAGAPIELVSVPRREMRLRTVLAPVVPLYDYIFIDCAPSLDLLTVNALCAADTVIIPMQCEFFALEGLSELMTTLKTVRKKYNRYLDIEGVLFTMYAGRLNLTMQVVAQVKKYFGDKVYRAVIPRTVRLSEAPSFGMPINFYEPNGKGCDAYMELAREFLANNER